MVDEVMFRKVICEVVRRFEGLSRTQLVKVVYLIDREYYMEEVKDSEFLSTIKFKGGIGWLKGKRIIRGCCLFVQTLLLRGAWNGWLMT